MQRPRTAAALAAIALLSMSACSLDAPSSFAQPVTTPPASPILASIPVPSPPHPSPTPPAASIEPSEHAWWAIESLAFGTTGFEESDPDPPVQPDAFRQLTVGMLDGRITAVIPLHGAWAHSYVAGPYGTDVLVTNDLGTDSAVTLVSARDGTRTDLFRSEDLIAAAAIGEGGMAVYYVPVDRATNTDRGLWRWTFADGRAERVVDESFGTLTDGPEMYWITADPLRDVVVVQFCFGQVRCETTAVDLVNGDLAERGGLGWPLGADATTIVTSGLADSTTATAWTPLQDAVDTLPGGEDGVPVRIEGDWWVVRDEYVGVVGSTVVIDEGGDVAAFPGDDPRASELSPLGERRGVALPTGWVLRWPSLPIFQDGPTMGDIGTGQLLDVLGGSRIPLPPFTVDPPHVACPVLVPARLPDGHRPGFGVPTLADGIRSVTWGKDVGMVRLDTGHAAFGDPATMSDGVAVEIRGNPGRALLTTSPDAGAALTWRDGDCAYTAWLTRGASLGDAIAYAAAY